MKRSRKTEIKVKKSNVVRNVHLAEHITSSTIPCTNNRVDFWHWLRMKSRQGPPAWLIAHQNFCVTESYENALQALKKWKKENSQHIVNLTPVTAGKGLSFQLDPGEMWLNEFSPLTCFLPSKSMLPRHWPQNIIPVQGPLYRSIEVLFDLTVTQEPGMGCTDLVCSILGEGYKCQTVQFR